MIRALTTGPANVGARINKATVSALVNRYKTIQHTTLKNKIGHYDSIYAWFSIEDLRIFLQDMEAYPASGVRVYFGAINNPDSPEYHNKLTVAFVCTQQIEGTDCHEELIDDIGDVLPDGYNFGSLCPPECNHCACEGSSIAKDIFLDTPCDMS